MADIEDKTPAITIVSTVLTGICTFFTIVSTWIAWRVYTREISPSSSGGGAAMPKWLWFSLCSFGVLSVVSVAINAWVWRLQASARKDRAEVERLRIDLHESAKSNLEYRAKLDQRIAITFNEEWQKLDYVSVYERGYKVLQIFTALQIEAFQICHDLNAFMEDIGPPPVLDWSVYDTGTESGMKEYTAMLEGPFRVWQLRLTGTYEQDFSPRVKTLCNSFKKQGYYQNFLAPLAEGVHDWADLGFVRDSVIALAHRPNKVDLLVKEPQ